MNHQSPSEFPKSQLVVEVKGMTASLVFPRVSSAGQVFDLMNSHFDFYFLYWYFGGFARK